VFAELRSLDTGPRTLRRFGLAVGGVLFAAGAWFAWRSGTPAAPAPAILLAVGSLLVISGSVAPSALRWPFLAWMGLALVLGAVMTRVILTLVYFLVVTPVGLVMRALGRDPMHRRADPDADTYWIRRDPDDDPRKRLTRYW
jgi:hypothetical protein